MKYTTTNLKLKVTDKYRIHERTIANCGWASIFVVTLLLISNMLRPVDAPTREVLAPMGAKPIIVIATAQAQPPLPTLTPWPTPEPVVIIQQAPAPPPVVEFVEVPIYVQAAPAQEMAVDTPEPPQETLCDERCLNGEPRLQTIAIMPSEEELSPAQLREAQDK